MRLILFSALTLVFSMAAPGGASEHDKKDSGHHGDHSAADKTGGHHAEESAHGGHGHGERPPEPQGLWFDGEKHLANVRQLTFGGQNAEAYWAPDGLSLIYQWTVQDGGCDQIYILGLEDGAKPRMVSTGKGRTTCAYFLPGTDRVLFSSTHARNPECPPPPDYSMGYVWPIDRNYDLWTCRQDGSDLQRLTDTGEYDAEATTSVSGEWIVFTSTRGGDLDLWKVRPDGSDLTQLTDTPGYDGGAFFSADGTKICFRASRPQGEALESYQALLKQGLVRPSKLDIYWMNADGTNVTRVTDNGAANFAPYFTPDGKRILFASNVGDPKGRDFDLWIVNLDGTGLEQVTHCTSFDSFPMFSPDGKHLAFASNRNGSVPGETNIFVAEWVD